MRLIVVLLLATDGRDVPMRVLGTAAEAQPDPVPAPFPPDRLTEAENRVLRYLPTNLSTPEIAKELFCSASTVRTHIRHVYAKLGTNSRSEAVKRARALDMLADPGAGSPALSQLPTRLPDSSAGRSKTTHLQQQHDHPQHGRASRYLHIWRNLVTDSSGAAQALLIMDIMPLVVPTFGGDDELLGRLADRTASARAASVPVIYGRVTFRAGYPDLSPENLLFAGATSQPDFSEDNPATGIHPVPRD